MLPSPLKNLADQTSQRVAVADIATWLAWQKRPGEGLYYPLEAKLLDQNAAPYLALNQWLRSVFPA